MYFSAIHVPLTLNEIQSNKNQKLSTSKETGTLRNFPPVAPPVLLIEEIKTTVVMKELKAAEPPVKKKVYRAKNKGDVDFHFVHIPKCGGTSMTTVLRELACSLDPKRNEDCCTNPGFCDWHAFRRCESIKGIKSLPNHVESYNGAQFYRILICYILHLLQAALIIFHRKSFY